MNNPEAKQHLPPLPPGEILLDQFLKPMGISQYQLCKAIGIDQERITEIIRGTKAITADTAIRLSLFLGTSAQLWMNLQSAYDLECAEDERRKLAEVITPWTVTEPV
ncbi:HigA family addiction module antitoxin [Magnetococcales bacterium HHB-1]